MRLVKTCSACPEQYDAFQGKELIGYLRLRSGVFRVTCPHVGGALVYEASIGDDMAGSFTSEKERTEQLDAAKNAIRAWLKGRESP